MSVRKFVNGMVATCALISASASVSAGPILDDIAKSGELRVCFDAGYMPFEMKSKNGSYVGFDIDLGKMMARQMGVKYVPVNTAWDGIIPTLLTGKCHMINAGMTINAQRNMRVNFADPYIVIGQSILLNPKLEGKVTSYKDLNNGQYTVVTKLGTTGEQATKRMLSKAKLNVFETQADAALEVANGKADALIYDMPFNAIYAAQNKGKVVHLEQPFTYEPLGWAIAQGDSDMLNFLNNFLRQIKGDGTYDRIYDKWFKDDSWLSQVQ
ncbi:transporter substrate-binding domain-containing protein [Photobacterium ganghwense]|uniref:Amino acid ABC transporter substrate-binding protein n=2 Tax=Vibrionaceae TaxID=641 RepID=A0A0J1H9K2_9GAMM|nr:MULTISPECIES: transporter substrate-binding domain-containing protein [Photobacterium]KLV08364.1 amino acid ABC transporter substrate-binding protein [Photobacterium ganghwense]MBV1843160.1 transporter substrate-binding domain-containing protein [Photobacterium ganghwense]PSU07499.1 amino acid ABC transporter substrate-binding protein [Photobacterium ganghwense]QSV16233.1 transporter substrate-binding domain-containing protein [Photobacterium ganghwense]